MSLSFMQRGLSFCHLFVKAGKCKNKKRKLPSNKTYSLIGRQLIDIRSVCDASVVIIYTYTIYIYKIGGSNVSGYV